MEEDVRYREELLRWNQQMNKARRTLSPEQEDTLREWQRQGEGGGGDISQWPGWEELIGKKPMSGHEERSSFREERLAKIAAGETPVPLDRVPRVVVHMVPHKKQELDLVGGVDRQATDTHLAPMVARYRPKNEYQTTVGDEAYISYAPGSEGVSSYAYSQLFPDGSIEHVRASYYVPERKEMGLDYEEDVIDAVRRGLILQEMLGVEAPIAVTLCLVGIAGCRLRFGERPAVGEPMEKDQIKIGEVIFSTHQHRTNDDVRALLKHAFDTVRRAGRPQPKRF